MRRPIAGFTMVEVLVAVLLLAVGLVGALAMQAHAMRTRQESALQTEALQAAATLADRIRANAAQSSSYLGFEFDAAAAGAPDAPADCAVAPCNAATIARLELSEFRRHLVAALPLARAVICRDASAAPGGQLQWPCSGAADAPVVIKIGWRSRRPDGASASFAAAPGIALPVALAGPPVPPPATPSDSPGPPPNQPSGSGGTQ
ncbi:type IV pilus assembly protein PilV [Duganella sp. CF458]|uniref:type IV pilus modification protein PilV n=1 Tax=Duganella sp. CF458 TaxID=1884368 RepID=UPI0008ED8477|nr:type IV pilus modification protein PilV [Duganella sp. CF458]SFG79131.1 type IV pilus assembly protein PilV [Duganella sp. CF458]